MEFFPTYWRIFFSAYWDKILLQNRIKKVKKTLKKLGQVSEIGPIITNWEITIKTNKTYVAFIWF